MRNKRDYRPSCLVKEKYLMNNFGDSADLQVKAVFEDEPSCIQMYKDHNLVVYDCKKEKEESTVKIRREIQRTFRYSVYI